MIKFLKIWCWLQLAIVSIVSVICAVMNFNLVRLMAHERGMFAQWELALIPVVMWWIVSMVASILFWIRYRQDAVWMSAIAKWLTIVNGTSIIALVITFALKV